MYIIQMADLHIGSSVQTEPNESDLVLQSAELVKKIIPQNETILICLCGDIIDSKGLETDAGAKASKRYDMATDIIEKFKEKIGNKYTIVVKCCPGNHDVTHMDELYDFVKRIDDRCPSQTELKSCYTAEIENSETKMVFVNSCKEEQYEKGCIDYNALEQKLKQYGQDDKKIIVLHHTVISMFDEDNSSIRNAAKLVNLIEKYNVIGILHGHIHGREMLSLGKNQCKIIGTGALFSRGNTNVNSQFNIIELRKNIFLQILNCRFDADGGNEPWDTKELNTPDSKNVIISSTFSQAYKQLMDRLDVVTPIYAMRMEIRNTYEKFCCDLEQFLDGDKLKLGNKEWTYFDLAKMWQSDEVPNELYFNHGSYFKREGKSGVDFILEMLKRKSSSNRIVLSTYNMENVYESLDDEKNLPSLVSIQFGKKDDTLIVYMHLRALEAKQFLKINICEIDYLLKQMKQKSFEFEQVEIVISAFSVQKRERFSCFLKAEIDEMETTELTTKVNYRKISDLRQLLEEKRDARETITKANGIQTLSKAIQDSNKIMVSDGKKPIYDEETIVLLAKVLDVYEELDKIHKVSSIRTSHEINCEQEIDSILGNLIEKLKEVEGVKAE